MKIRLVFLVVLALLLSAPCWGTETVVGAWQSAGGAFSARIVSVNAADGSCWVADTANSQIVHLSAAGAELWRSK